jgi:Cysteine rich repeat
MLLLDRVAVVGSGRLAAFLLCCLAGQAAAQQPTQAQRDTIRQSCRSNYQTYCANVPSGGQASLQCLQQHLTDLSPSCQAAVNAVGTEHAPPPAVPPAMSRRQEAALLRGACGRDFSAYCHDVRLGGGRGLACLAENQARLSPPCKGALAEMRAGR